MCAELCGGMSTVIEDPAPLGAGGRFSLATTLELTVDPPTGRPGVTQAGDPDPRDG